MLKTTKWLPDTCNCVIEYTWDDAVDESERTHTFSRVLSTCAFHGSCGTDDEQYQVILKENETKNCVRNCLLGNERLTYVYTDSFGQNVTGFLQTINVDFSFSGQNDQRTLLVSITGIELTEQEKSEIQNLEGNKIPVQFV